jgi:methionine--tRNA ligase beta chain
MEQITFDDFEKLDIRIAKIVKAEKIENSNKLLRLEVDLGSEIRQLVAGIAQEYKPEEIVGKQVPILMNLKPATLMSVESKGMILAADDNGKAILLHPDREVRLGSKVR